MSERNATHLVKQFDGQITVKSPDGIYQDTTGNFSLDAGRPFPTLPEGFIGRTYIPNEKHALTDGASERQQRLPWAPGDDILLTVPELLAAQQARSIVDPGAPLADLRLQAIEALLDRKAADPDATTAEADYQAARNA